MDIRYYNYLQVAGRAVAVYLFIILAIRLFGKKELTQLSVVDLVFILLISNSVQNAMVGPDTTLAGGLIAAAALFGTNYFLKLTIYRSRIWSKLIQGEPVMLIYKGKLKDENLRKVHLSRTELEVAAREHGLQDLKEVDLAVLEVDGNISILTQDFKSQHKTHRSKLAGHPPKNLASGGL
ncbi:DUF421 domain-containing protein [Adhaeribacter pallidiroseus]|uniref:UPF0702 transmembrane protein YetF n=1 Tax=Adhaeribacter pallidiroseus TaxID=2072847 RepID=A0A369QH96_9BACT|nr:YetF domain-containing protein [Adhaeribacter pallidiroseus]RDC61658.1 UPF0702 transmembrane protein YetF [Adhaeribacter pallidiroseus]